MQLRPCLRSLGFAGLLFPFVALATDRYVSLSGDDIPPYTNWATAARTIQDAVDEASAGDIVWVTNGVYDAGGAVTPGYALSNRVVIAKAIKLCSVNGPAVTTIAGCGPLGAGAVRCVHMAARAEIVGFTLSSGATYTNQTYPWENSGGGVLMSMGGVVSNCVVTDCVSGMAGGGIWAAADSVIAWCQIEGNRSDRSGGVRLNDAPSARLDNSVIQDNWARLEGGGVQIYHGATVNNCLITGNRCDGNGGGAHVDYGTYSGSQQALFNNCTIVGNTAGQNGGVGYIVTGGAYRNTIIWGNTNGNWSGGTFASCCTVPLPSGTGNITNDPMFVQSGFDLAGGSPCINDGNNAYASGSVDVVGRARILGGTVDIGAYEASVTMLSNVVVWGRGDFGQLSAPGGLTNAIAVAAGNGHDLVLSADGTVTAWGRNNYGQANVPVGLTGVVRIAAGDRHSLALRADGTVVGWGANDYSQTNVPSGLSNVVAISAGYEHGLALRSDGTVVGWGTNNNNQISIPSGLSNAVAVAGGSYYSLALRADGTVLAWGWNGYGQVNVPSGLSNVVAIAAGYAHGVALRADGTVAAWGLNTSGQTTVPSGLSNVVAVSAGYDHSMALKADGTVVAWGGSGYGQTTIPSGLSGVVGVSAGGQHSMALVGVGRPFLAPAVSQIRSQFGTPVFLLAQPAGERPMSCQWQKDGSPVAGATNALLTLTAASASQAGDYRCVVSNARGTTTGTTTRVYVSGIPAPVNNVVAWGRNDFGQVDVATGLTNAVAVGGGVSAHSLALRADGTVAAWGRNNYGQADVPSELGSVRSVTVGDRNSLALRMDGTVAEWGANDYGQTNVPVGLSNVVAISAGYAHSVVLRADGTVVAWGRYDYGQTNVPVGLSNVVAVAGGAYHSVALRADGTVAAWGYNSDGQGVVPAGLSNVVAIAAGYYHNVALRTDGTVTAWGLNTSGQATVPAGLSNVVAVSAGYDHSMALKADGTVVAWGANGYGQRTIPSGLSNVVAIAAHGQHSLAVIGVGRPFLAPTVSQVRTQLGTPVFLPAQPAGERPMGCQWQKGGSPVAGATNALLTLTAASTNQSGDYCCVVSNARGVTTGTTTRVYVSGTPASVNNVVLWGRGDFGQLDAPGGLTNAVAVAAGNGHALVLSADGTVTAWGRNNYGQANVPVGLTGVVRIAAGDRHSLALRADGTVVGWGANDYSQTNVPAGLSNVVAISAGYEHGLAVRADGTVVGWGTNNNNQISIPSGLSNAVAVAGGSYYSLALRADGTVLAWGWNGYGQVNVPPGLSNVVAIAAGYAHGVALRADGTVAAWGLNTSGQTTVPSGLSNVVAIAAGYDHSLALKADGKVVAWGGSGYGQTTVPPGLGGVAGVSAGGQHSMALVGVGRPFLAPAVSQIRTQLGTPAFLLAQPAGERPMSCQWQKDGSPVAGATNALLTLTAASTNQSGDYRCVVSNARGVTTGTTTRVSVLIPEVSVVIRGVPVPRGVSAPLPYGTNRVALGTVVTNAVTSPADEAGGVRYVCAGWTGTGSVPSVGSTNRVTFQASQASTLSWLWARECQLELVADNGAIDGATPGWKPDGFIYDLSPSNAYGFVFDHWVVDGTNAGASVPLTITSDAPHAVEAVFASAFVDVSQDVDTSLTTWRLSHQTGTYYCDVPLCVRSDSRKRLMAPFWYAVQSNANVRLLRPNGIDPVSGFPYVDITSQVVARLPSVGNGDAVLDPGECVVVSNVEFYSRDRSQPQGFVVAVWADPPGNWSGNAASDDTDRDGMPNAWERRWACLDPNNPADGAADGDGDGLSNVDEYRADTRPNDPASCLMAASLRRAPEGLVIGWVGGTGVTQYVERSSNLLDWSVIHTNLPPTPEINEMTMPDGVAPVFIRIRVGQP